VPTRNRDSQHIYTRTLRECLVLNHWPCFTVFHGHSSCGRTLSPFQKLLPPLDIYVFLSHSDRMVTFSIALVLFCFVISNLWTQMFVGLTSAPMSFFTLWCLWITWKSPSDREVWLRGLRPSIARALQRIRSSALIKSFRDRLASRAQDVDGVHSSTGPQGDADV